MISTDLVNLAHQCQGQLQGINLAIEAVSIDSRQIPDNTLFIAISGERFDGHDFAQQAVEAGAVALVVERELPIAVPQIKVTNTRQALGQIAAWVHQQAHRHTPTIAITGSCGKTTVKTLLAHILAEQGQGLVTQGNYNNEIGVPLTLLNSRVDDEFAVIELGANHQGEIAYTVGLVKPQVALVTNVAAAHLEGFSSLDGVKRAKGEIYQGLAKAGVAIVNLDSQGGCLWQSVLADKQQVIFAQYNPNADFYAKAVHQDAQARSRFTLVTPQGEMEISLALLGEHNITNAVAAAAAAMQMGASLVHIQQGLAQAQAVAGRLAITQLTETIQLIDDSYNASVPAMKAAIDLLSHFEVTRWLILGNMAELGNESLALHQQVGEHAAPFSFEHVLTYGADAKVISQLCGGHHFTTHQALLDYVFEQLAQAPLSSHLLLVKGSHSSGMSQIVDALKEKYS